MFHTIFFDLDNTLYPADSGLWEAIGAHIETYLSEEMHMSVNDADKFRIYCRENFGTTLQGLKSLYDIDEQQYLKYVHDVDLSLYLSKDQHLISLIESLPQRKIIFTNADENHSRHVLRYLEIEPFFEQIIDVHKLKPYVKPDPESYRKALELAEISSAGDCIFLDDYLPNVLGAQEAGYFSVLVSNKINDYPHQIQDIFGLPDILTTNSNQG
jgi:pyrimidine 5'-nucleotidase